jgi:hypothetical protein
VVLILRIIVGDKKSTVRLIFLFCFLSRNKKWNWYFIKVVIEKRLKNEDDELLDFWRGLDFLREIGGGKKK